MTIEEWMSQPELAIELKEVLNAPAMQKALTLIKSHMMSSSIKQGQVLQIANSAQILFGYDMGRNSVLDDLKRLTVLAEETETQQPNYTE